MTIMANSAAASGAHVPGGWVAGTWTIDPAHSMVIFSVRPPGRWTWRSSSSAATRRACGGEPRVGFSALASTSRRDFGITFGLVGDGAKIVVADAIDIALDVQAFAAPGSRGR